MHAASPDSHSVLAPHAQGGLTLPVQRIDLSRDRHEPLYQQLYTQIRGLITDGCPAGTRLPASRRLADELGVSRNTVMLAYQRLHEDGSVSGRAGGGTVVQAIRPEALRLQPGRADSQKAVAGGGTARPGAAFAVGVPPVDLFPLGLWASMLTRKLRTSGDRIMRGGNGMGQWPLRGAIAAHLNLLRGIPCAPEQVVVTRGRDAGLDLVIRTLLSPGDRAWCEEPGYPYVRRALRYRGCVPLAIPVDAEGLNVTAAADGPEASMAIVSPARHLPMAVRMSSRRRAQLLDCSGRTGMWIVEHENDGAFLDVPAPKPLCTDDPNGRVIYLGTFNTALFPQLHLGFCILPAPLAATASPPLTEGAAEVSTIIQETLADLLEHHRFARSFGQLRSACTQRREILRSALEAVPDLIPAIQGDTETGSYLTVTLPPRINDRQLTALGRRESLALAPLSHYFDSAPPVPGLVLGCAGTREDALGPALRRLERLISSG